MIRFIDDSYNCDKCGKFKYRAKYTDKTKSNGIVFEKECFNFKRAIKNDKGYEFIIYCPKCLKTYSVFIEKSDL